MLSSLMLHDFFTAAMIISLDLYECHINATRSSAENPDARAKIFDAWRLSCEIWTSRRETSRDARHASRILAVMLSKLSNTIHGSDMMVTQPPTKPWELLEPSALDNLASLSKGTEPDFQLDTSSAEPLDTVFNDPDNIDWVSRTSLRIGPD